MSRKKDNEALRTLRQLDEVRWESNKELGITDANRYVDGVALRPDMGVKGDDSKDLVKAGEETIRKEGLRKTLANLEKDVRSRKSEV
ncbi:alpha/beta-type small acid-soluble spore protein [Desulforudis sp. 1088]|jgi:hypothetical protein|uniref:alpha/beta-type small acid-soluble spore protein n=1 Tax=unclassified Candidatus Desulforudis TaxID=2635950 RepID=UPI0034822B75